ncbi:uncharacterized protein LOC116035515 [Sander lucioperca]|uniref:uncharacterized protein LOC116035515 n=1 Tax=Sander lucioperca TaxID=283035 RepID=UPI00125E785C|nr:uncharacterized protein LOC116035515 [Sander lucioperca]
MGHQKWYNTVDLALIVTVFPLNVYLLCQTSLHVSVKMLVQVKYSQQQKYVKLDEDEGRFDFMQFHEKVIERFCLPPDAKVIYKDATGTEVDAEIFSDLVGQGNVVLTVFSDQEFSDFSLSSASETSDSSFSSSASTIILDDVPSKRQRIEDTRDAVSAKQLIETVLRGKSGGEEVLQEYQTTETLTDAARRKMVNILVAHMIDNHGHHPTKAIREDYARGIVMLFPSLKDPYSKKGYVIGIIIVNSFMSCCDTKLCGRH